MNSNQNGPIVFSTAEAVQTGRNRALASLLDRLLNGRLSISAQILHGTSGIRL